MMQLNSIHSVAVLGLGTMGHGIAQTFARAGYSVRGYDEARAARKSLHDRVRQNLRSFVDGGLVRAGEVERILARIAVFDDEQETVESTQFVTEAVREELRVKQELLPRIERMVSGETILASNSSTFPISQSAARMKRPQRAIVAHWFNPPHIVPVVEVVPGPRTSAATTRTTLALMKKIGKEAVHIRKEIPGFLINRCQAALMREVWDLLDRGVASVADLDAAVRGTMGFRLAAIGQLEVGDFGGLDVHTAVFRNLAPDIKSDTKLPTVVKKLVEAGHLGVKSGRGFYRYTPRTIAAKRSLRDKRFLALLRLLYPPTA
jgi:3-hydroxybutyryl-CoA dehydrogenase